MPTILITGATSGIGKRTAEMFAAEGAKVVIAGRREPEGLAVAKSIGASSDFVKTDVTIEAQVQALIEFTLRKYGRIDCLFNNAGFGGALGPIAKTTVDDAAREAGFARAQPILAAMGKTIVHVGPAGAGQVVKVCKAPSSKTCTTPP